MLTTIIGRPTLSVFHSSGGVCCSANRWFNGARWAATAASIAKDNWASTSEEPSQLTFGRYGGGLFAGRQIQNAAPFEYAPWNPDRENASEYRSRVKSEFTKHLNSQIEAQKQIGQIARLPDDEKLERDARWLVRYQFCLESFAEIARGDELAMTVSPDTVRKAVQNLALMIELDLRAPDPAGRPPKTRK